MRKLKLKFILWLIDGYLVKGDSWSIHLWYILTALRGPDVNSNGNKWVTTCVVRAAAFPRCANDGNIPATFNPYNMYVSKSAAKAVGSHFSVHLGFAVTALSALGKIIKVLE